RIDDPPEPCSYLTIRNALASTRKDVTELRISRWTGLRTVRFHSGAEMTVTDGNRFHKERLSIPEPRFMDLRPRIFGHARTRAVDTCGRDAWLQAGRPRSPPPERGPREPVVGRDRPRT